MRNDYSKQAVYNYLDSLAIRYETTEHKAVHTMDELSETCLPHPEAIAKNLFVCDDKKQDYYLITVKSGKRVNLKALRRAYGTRPLSLAGEDALQDILRLTPGSVTPLGILNDTTCRVHFFLDKDFLTFPAIIGIHPNDNTATIWLNTEDLLYIIRTHGNEVTVVSV